MSVHQRVSSHDITWIASYPKSGNTWLRVLLTVYLSDHPESFDINRLSVPYISVDRSILQSELGVDIDDLTAMEIDRFQPEAYRSIALKSAKPIMWKTHNALRQFPSGRPTLPIDVSGKSIYLIRHPFDVAVSFANHQCWSLGETAKMMADRRHYLSGEGVSAQSHLREFLGSWSDHVNSWCIQSDVDVMMIRYEDLFLDTYKTFTNVLHHISIPVDSDRVEKSVKLSSFQRLKKVAEASGFSGGNPLGGRFFRRGRPGGWKEDLPLSLQQSIRQHHGEVMEQFDY